MASLFVKVNDSNLCDLVIISNLKNLLKRYIKKYGSKNTYWTSIAGNIKKIIKFSESLKITGLGEAAKGNLELIKKLLKEYNNSLLIIFARSEDLMKLQYKQKKSIEEYDVIKIKIIEQEYVGRQLSSKNSIFTRKKHAKIKPIHNSELHSDNSSELHFDNSPEPQLENEISLNNNVSKPNPMLNPELPLNHSSEPQLENEISSNNNLSKPNPMLNPELPLDHPSEPQLENEISLIKNDSKPNPMLNPELPLDHSSEPQLEKEISLINYLENLNKNLDEKLSKSLNLNNPELDDKNKLSDCKLILKNLSNKALLGAEKCESLEIIEENYENAIEKIVKQIQVYPSRFNTDQITLWIDHSENWSHHIFTLKNNTKYLWLNISIVFVKNNINETTFGCEFYGDRLCEIEKLEPFEQIIVKKAYMEERIENLGFFKVQVFYHSHPVSNTVNISSISFLDFKRIKDKLVSFEYINNLREIKNIRFSISELNSNSKKITNIMKLPPRTLSKLPASMRKGIEYMLEFHKDSLLLNEPLLLSLN